MKLLVIGQGGREHAIAWKCLQSNQCDHAYVMPGNAGMTLTPNISCIENDPKDIKALVNFIQDKKIDLVIIGPENALADGIVDALTAKGILVLGPTQAAAKLESSKIFSKQFMLDNDIPTAYFEICEDYEDAMQKLALWQEELPPVIKLDGLASGKGVFIPETIQEAEKVLFNLYQNIDYPLSADKLLLEARIQGHEVSAFIISDGEHYVNLGLACDYKRLLDDNKGPNTGGMGCYIPEKISDQLTIEDINTRVFTPVIQGMKKNGSPFKGFLFAGLMIDGDDYKVLEFNVRLGDPETQTILPAIENDFFEICLQAAKGSLPHEKTFNQSEKKSVHVVMTSGGYPGLEGPISLGHEILGLDKLQASEYLFAAGIAQNESNQYINQGGRVLGITTLADNIDAARERTYQAIDKIHFENVFYRKDIAKGR